MSAGNPFLGPRARPLVLGPRGVPHLTAVPELPTELGRASADNRDPEVLVNALLEANAVGRWIDSSVVAAEHTLVDHDTVERLRRRGVAFGSYTFYPLEMTGGRRRLDDAGQTDRLRQVVAAAGRLGGDG